MPINHIVESGDCINSIAKAHGFFPDTVWNHSDNAALKQQRKNMNLLVPGDRVVIPDMLLREEEKSPAQRHRFRRRGVPSKLKLRVMYRDEPRRNAPFKADVDGRVHKGRTDGDGVLEVPIDPEAQQVQLTVGEPGALQEYCISLGELQPISTLAGVRARLTNLGFRCSSEAAQMDDATREAIRLFQASFEHPNPTGELDDQTRQKLLARHGK